MGSSKDIMQTFAQKEIRAHFKGWEGWSCRQVPSPYGGDMTFILSRDVRGRTENMALAVSYDEDPSTLALEALVASMKGKALKGQFLIVPNAAAVSGIPKTVHVIFMESFGFVEGKLVWLTKKKNAKQYSQPEASVTAETATIVAQPNAS
jgi:hypothetical protein